MNDPSSKFNKLIIIKKSEIEAILASLRAETPTARTQAEEKKAINQPPPQLNPAAYNDYRWLIKAEEETDGQ